MIGSFTEAPIISVKVIFWTLFLRQGFISAFAFSQILRWLKVWWHNNLSISQHKVVWLILIFDDQVASKLQINPTHSLVSVLFLTSSSFNGDSSQNSWFGLGMLPGYMRLPKAFPLMWDFSLSWFGGAIIPHLFYASSFGDVLDTLTLLFSKINSSGNSSQSCL